MEVAGLVLGAFPLFISAVEHFRDAKRASVNWWKFKRVYEKELGKVKNLKLAYEAELDALLAPLLEDHIVEKHELDALLADPGGQVWRAKNVEDALLACLGDARYVRYCDILEELKETMLGLCKVHKVDDVLLGQYRTSRPGSSIGARAFFAVQTKRITYTLSDAKRNELLQEVDRNISELQKRRCEGASMTAQRASQPRMYARLNKQLLNYWEHAARIFELLHQAWHCNCRSRAHHTHIWLQKSQAAIVDLILLLPFCHGGRYLAVAIDRPKTLQLGSTGRISMVHATAGASQTRRVPAQQTNVVIVSVLASSAGTAMPSQMIDLQNQGLCKSVDAVPHTDHVVGTLIHDDNDYTVKSLEPIHLATVTSLKDILLSKPGLRFARVRRYELALSIAMSFLRLKSSPWLRQAWTSAHVRVSTLHDPADQDHRILLHGEPYVHVDFAPSDARVSHQQGGAFLELAVLLLELGLGQAFEDLDAWKQAAFAGRQAEPSSRRAVALAWYHDQDALAGETGMLYANAVDWTLKAPVVIVDNSWRPAFAQYVVQSLQQALESMC